MFAQWYVDRVAEDSDFHTRVLWTDECMVRLKGSWNAHNTVWWGIEKPSQDILDRGVKSSDRRSVMVWVGVCASGMLGPFFLEGRVTADSYLTFLKEKVLPELPSLGVEWFQQDGAPAHYAKTVRDHLDSVLPES